MKILIPIILMLTIVSTISCKKDCEPQLATCNDKPPTGETCKAMFNRWFFNKKQNKCVQIGYGGCSQKGFATQAACEACKCK